MSRYLKCLMVFALTFALNGARAQSARAEQVEAMLQEVSHWLNSAWSAQYPGDPFIAQPLTMKNQSYLAFARNRFSGAAREHTGEPALSAFFESRGFVDGKTSSVCYLLFNSDRLSDLDTQFYFKTDSASQMGSTLFLVAHEAGHCLDRKLTPSSAPPPDGIDDKKPARWGEFGADIFAGLAVLEVTGDPSLLQKIAVVRKNGGPTHSTEPGIDELLRLSKLNALPRGRSIKDLWFLADNIRKKSFK